MHLLDIEGDLAEGLNGVGVEEDALLAAGRADAGDVLHDADLVVGVHERDENGPLLERRANGVRRDRSVRLGLEVGDPESFPFERAAGVEHGAVLGHSRDDVVALAPVGPGGADHGEVVRFRRPAREDDLLRVGMDRGGNLAARLVDCRLGLPAENVVARGGVAEDFSEIRRHRLDHARVDWRCRVVVHVNRQLHGVRAAFTSRAYCAFAARHKTSAGARVISARPERQSGDRVIWRSGDLSTPSLVES